MKEIRDLGLTIKQTDEVLQADPLLVSAWLDRIDDPTITNPVGWFLTGVRSGIFPHQLADSDRAKKIHLAERWITNAGLFVPDESNLLHELFDSPTGLLKDYRSEQPLRDKMVTLWQLERPRGLQVEQEGNERAARIRASREEAKYGRADT